MTGPTGGAGPDWRLPVGELFFAPGLDEGLWALDPMPRAWDRIAPGRIAGLAASDHAALNRATERHILRTFRERRFRSAVVIRSVPVVLEQVTTHGHFLACHGKYLLNGAAGTRLRNRFAQGEGKDDAATAWFEALQAADPVLPVWEGDTDELDLVIDARNGFNFYHFVTESLGQLCFVDHERFRGRVFVHIKGAQVAPFIRDWIAALFPRLAARVAFRTGRHAYDRCLSILNTRHLWFQTGRRAMDDLDGIAPPTPSWRGRAPDRGSASVLGQNACDEVLLRLRRTAHDRIAGGDWSHLPRRFWIARRSRRNREMQGEVELVAELIARGFAVVHFEDLAPLEQVALMARAEVMISYHGAGFANMAFAGADTHCIEIGNWQTAMYRWADFMPNAIASGCRYTSFFADFNTDPPTRDVAGIRFAPLHPVALGAAGRGKLLDHVDAILGEVRIRDADWLGRMATALTRTQDEAALRRLLQAHPEAVAADPDLTVRRAELHLADGDTEAGLRLLERAWKMTGDRPFLMERIVVMHAARGSEEPWLERHRALYPERAPILRRKLRQAGMA